MRETGFTRWHAAGLICKYVPDVRGRDRLLAAVTGPTVPPSLRHAPTEVHFGPGLTATVPLAADGSFHHLFLAAYTDPALVPIFQAVLGPGDVCYDIGANIGIYSLWASRIVGDNGRVYAFEPVPGTARWLTALIAENAAANIEFVPRAVSSHASTMILETVAHASGLSHIARESMAHEPGHSGEDEVKVEAVVFDQFAADHEPPTLVKIDVEGHELAVFAGMSDTLDKARPVVVFEAPDTVGAIGDTDSIVAILGQHGYRVWSLTRGGLVPYDKTSFSHNLLALHPADHTRVHDDLLCTRFARSQNC